MTSALYETLLHGPGEPFAATVEVGADGINGEVQGCGDALIAQVLLVVQHQNSAFGFREGEQGVFHGLLGFVVAEQLFGIAGVIASEGRRRLVFEPGAAFVVVAGHGHGGKVFAVAATALPLILGDVDRDAVEKRGKLGVAAKVREGTIEAKKDFLGQVFQVGAGTGEAMEGTEDKGLVLADEGFEVFRRCVVAAHARVGWYDREGS